MSSGTYSIRLENSILYYEKNDSEITITGGRIEGSRLVVPDMLDDLPVTAIGKKAFLGNSSLTEVILPENIKLIDSWAFGQCSHLKKIVILREGASKSIDGSVFGIGAFVSCEGLRYICIGDEAEDSLSVLLAACPCKLDAEYLLHDTYIGSNDWYAKWDQKLSAYLAEDNKEGYTDLVLCGEEHVLKTEKGFASEKKRKKAALCFLRLMNNACILDENKLLFETYILRHIKGCRSDEAWQALIFDFSDDMTYYKYYSELGGITSDNIDEMLLDLGEDHAEAKAFLISYKNDNFTTGDIFDSFAW